MRALIDPTDAIFEGMSSIVARAALAVAAFVMAFLCYSVPHVGFDSNALAILPIAVIGVLLGWSTKGALFFVGLAAAVFFLVVTRRFLDSVVPKACFLLLFLSAFVFFIPLTWSKELPGWKAYVAGGVFVVGYVVVAYLLPWVIELILAIKKKKEEEAAMAEEGMREEA